MTASADQNITQAIVLAGGLGTRLRAVVEDLPKVMAPVAGRPFLEHVLDHLAAQGLRRVILAVSYRREIIQAHFGEAYRGMALRYSVEEEPLGTGGAIRQAMDLAEPGLCFILNGDTWLDLDYAAMARAGQSAGARLVMAVRELPDVGRYGALEVREGRVTGFLEKGRSGPGAINAGVYLAATDLFDAHPFPPRFSFEQDLLMAHLKDLAPLAFTVPGGFIDIGIPEDFFRAQAMFAARN
jgi:D-glycero-alpha-D-manno-heptose 1-phosphate guanylyltransferase